jgi:Domain of unknown function (DU1801)
MAATKSSKSAAKAKKPKALKRDLKPMSVAEYLASLPADKRAVVTAARALVRKNVSKDYAEYIGWGGINWGIPLSEFSNTYNGHPLTYIALAPNKNNFSLHLMGAYGDPKQVALLKTEFKKAGKRLDMGMACLRFNSLDDLELKSVGKVIGLLSKDQYLAWYKKIKKL